jgi:hypothetical protein
MTTTVSSDNDRRNKSYWLPLENEETKKDNLPVKPELTKRIFTSKEVANTSIFAVLIDGVPKFYSHSKDDAIRKARNFLQINRKYFDRKYFIDNLPNDEIHLTSVNKFFLFQNETLEHVAKICKIPQVRFMTD